MKQLTHGKKVQNWHRPLGRRALKRWFLRHRHDSVFEEGEWCDWDQRRIWDETSPDENSPENLQYLELKQLLREILQRPVPVFDCRGLLPATLAAAADAEAPELPAKLLEQRLAAFVTDIKHFPSNPAHRERIREAIGEDVALDAIKAAGKDGKGNSLVEHVCLFAPFWIRSPRTWDKRATSLVDHLFVRYNVPRFLDAEWSRAPDLARLKWLAWFILFAQGGSLRRAARLLDWHIPGSLEHYLWQAPAETTPEQACTFAEVLRRGGSRKDGWRILQNRAFVVDTTAGRRQDAPFWDATVRWIIAHGASITDAQCEQILSWGLHELTETERTGAAPFSWKGRTLPAVLERSLAYQQELGMPWSPYVWLKHGWDWAPADLASGSWSFVELCTGQELFQEGQAMAHCVAGYATACAAGRSAIVSMRCKGERRVTVEVAPPTRQIVQAKGPCNRPATGEEEAVMRRWLESVVWRPAALTCPAASH